MTEGGGGLTALQVRRLALPKYLAKEAERALQRSDTYAHALATSLLQDAVEAFLRVLADLGHIHVGPSAAFDKLLGDVAKQFPVVGDHRAALSNLNKARVAFKHHGLSVPDRIDARAFATNVRDFLADVTREVLGVDFAAVSLVDAIGHQRTENWLGDAEQALVNNEHEDAMCKVAGAFAIYVTSRQGREARTGWHARSAMGLRSSGLERDILKLIEMLDGRLATVEGRLHLAMRGVDMAAFDRFQALTPLVSFMADGSLRFAMRTRLGASAGDVRFASISRLMRRLRWARRGGRLTLGEMAQWRRCCGRATLW